MGIERIESVTYWVEDLDECARFVTDFGLTPSTRDTTTAEFETLTGQRLRVTTLVEDHWPPAVEPAPCIREVVWGVDSPESLDRIVAAVAVDRPITRTDDGTHHFADESGFGVGLTLARPRDPAVRTVDASNAPGRVERWNQALAPISEVKPIRMCHVALNIAKDGHEEANAFYQDRLGFIARDVVKPMGTFMQAEGDDDQHTFLLCHRPDRVSTNHVSFDVPTFDDVIQGGNHMIDKGWREARRLGRHTVGSNVFRFIHAPLGGRFELAADMDRVDDSYGTRFHEETPPHHIWQLQGNRDESEKSR